MHAIFIDTTMTTPPTGGAHSFLVDLCAPVIANGWSLSFVTQPGTEPAIVQALQLAGADVHDNVWKETDLPEERAQRLATWVNAQKPDVYVISTSPDVGWLALPLLDSSIPTVSMAHNDVGAYYEPLKHYGQFIDQAVSVSKEIQRKTIEECGVPPERVRQIPYGVQSLTRSEASARAEASQQGERLKIGYVGRVVREQKRVLEMAPLAAELERRGIDFELYIVGEGEARSDLTQELKRAGLEERATFTGWLTPTDVRRLLTNLDVFLLLSEYEGLSVALLEAMGHALVPVVTRINSGTGEVVDDGRNGFLIPVGDIGTFADRLEQLARDRKLLASMKLAAWEVSQRYTIDHMAEDYLRCFNDVRQLNLRNGRRSNPEYPVMLSCRSPYPFWLRKIKQQMLAAVGRAR